MICGLPVGVDAAPASAQNLVEETFEGSWEGTLEFQDEPLRLRMDVNFQDDPAVKVGFPQLLMAEQNADYSISLSKTPVLQVALPLAMGSYDFVRNGDMLVAQRTTKAGQSITIRLGRAPEIRLARQQLSFGAAGPPIQGTLVFPPGQGPFPLAILLAGSGNPTRSNWSYASMANFLAEAGIASLVYDRRLDSETKPGGSRYNIDDHAADVRAAIDLLAKDARIDSARIGLIAKSRGGWIALQAASRDPRISYLVGIGISAVPVIPHEYQALEAKMRARDFPEQQIQDAIAYMRIYFQAVRDPALWPWLDAAKQRAAKAPWAELVQLPETRSDLDWYRAHQDMDSLSLIPRIASPMFLAWGENDRTTPPQMNKQLFEALLSGKSAQRSELNVYSDAGHTLEGPLNVDEDEFTIWEGVNQKFLGDMRAWLNRTLDRL